MGIRVWWCAVAVIGAGCSKGGQDGDRTVERGSASVAPPRPADASTRSRFLPAYADVTRIEVLVGIPNQFGTICERIDTSFDIDVATGRWSARHCIDETQTLEAPSGTLPPTTKLANLYDWLELYERKGPGCNGNDGHPIAVTVHARNGVSVKFDNEFDFPDCNAPFGVADDSVADLIEELETATHLDSLGTQMANRHSKFLPAFDDVATIEISIGIAHDHTLVCDRIDRQVTFDLAAGKWSGRACDGTTLTAASGKISSYSSDLLKNGYTFLDLAPHDKPGCVGDTKHGKPVTVRVRSRKGATVSFDNGIVAPACLPGLRVRENNLWPILGQLALVTNLRLRPPL